MIGYRFLLRQAVALGALALAARPSDSQSLVIRNATVVPVSGPRLTNASVVVTNGRIAAVGMNVPTPAGAAVIDGTGLFVYPGMIDSGTQLGLVEMGGVAGPNDTREIGDFNPQNVALTAVNMHSEHIPITRMNGVTSAITSAQGGLISGSAALIDLAGWTPEEMAAKARAAMVVSWPSVSGGGRGFGGGGGFGGGPQLTPAERRAAYDRDVRRIYDYFTEARAYADVKARLTTAGGALPTTFRISQQYEAMIAVVRGEEPVLIEATTADQMRSALQFADSARVRIVIRGARDGWRIADTLAMKKVPVILGPLTSPPGDDAPYDEIFANPGVLAKAGVQIAFQSGGAADARDLPYEVGLAVAFGLDGDAAYRSVTLDAAKIWGVDKDYGSIEVGKVANLIVTTGDPLDIRTKIRELIIRGQRVPFNDRHTKFYEQFRARPKPKP